MADVIVIGAGPAGTAAGRQIAEAGYEVLIIEKSCSPSRNKGARCILPGKCFTDIDLPEEMIIKEYRSLVYHFPGKEIHISNSSKLVLLDRAAFDCFLIQRTKEKGAKLLNSTLVSDVCKYDKGITVRYRKLPKGETQESRVPIVVFADGANTLAQRKFHVGFKVGPNCAALGATYDLKYPRNDLSSMDFFFHEEISPFGYGWIFPGKDVINVGLLCLLSRMKVGIRQYLDNFVSLVGLSSKEIIGYHSRIMPQSLVENLHGNSILVAGDAAGTADPIDGGGISNAVASGEVAGKVAVEALDAGNVTEDLAARYEDLWKKTRNYRLLKRSFSVHRLALKTNVHIGILLKQIGLFQQDNKI